MSFQTPILFLVFNRPEHTKKVFERIRQVKPKYLFIAADGPRISNEDDEKKCSRVREIVNAVDWSCELKTLFRERNLGCGKAVSTAIDWFFEHVEEGIILEDDTLPSISFFSFCSKMLEHYRTDTEVMHIGGSSFLFGEFDSEGSYYFSKYPIIWGWATWRRAWKHYNYDFTNEFDPQVVAVNCSQKTEILYWTKAFQTFMDGECDTWDYSWHYSVWRERGLSILPTTNLIMNIGIGIDSTHTRAIKSKYYENSEKEIDKLELKKDKYVLTKADRRYFNEFVKPDRTSLINLIRNNMSKLVGARNYQLLKNGKKKLLDILHI
jgi:hypothetical protein